MSGERGDVRKRDPKWVDSTDLGARIRELEAENARLRARVAELNRWAETLRDIGAA